jgi:hypothetical protein
MAARACTETSPPFHEDPSSASQELKAVRAANSLADESSGPLQDEAKDRREVRSEEVTPPQLVMKPVSQLEIFPARSSENAAELKLSEDAACSEKSLWRPLKRLLSECLCSK